MIVLSHRGRHTGGRHPDNSLEAIDGALRSGLRGVEIDVRTTRDGRAVLFHDRHAADGRRVEVLDHVELCHVSGYAVPTLDDVLARFAGALFDVELKTAAALDASEPALRRADPSALLVTSFLHDVVAAAAARLAVPCAPIAAYRAATPEAQPWRAFVGHPHVRAVVLPYEFVDAALIAAARNDGFAVWAWDLAGTGELERARGIGLAAAIVDA